MDQPLRLSVKNWGQGPPLILIHGWCLHSGCWQNQIDGLSDSFRIVSVDLPGHGQSSDPGFPFTLKNLLFALQEVISSFRGPVHLCGWSLGASLAVECTLLFPQDVLSLILIGGFPKFESSPKIWPYGQPKEGIQQLREELESNFEGTVRETFQKMLFDGETIDEGIQRKFSEYLDDRFSVPSPGPAFRLLDILLEIDLMERARSIQVPSLLIHGDVDRITSIKGAYFLHEQIRNSRLVVLENGSHAIPISRGDEVNQAIKGFISTV